MDEIKAVMEQNKFSAEKPDTVCKSYVVAEFTDFIVFRTTLTFKIVLLLKVNVRADNFCTYIVVFL